VVVAIVGAATVGIKALGPVLMGGKALPERLTGVVDMLAPAVLAALVVVQTVGDGPRLVLDDRLVGVAVAGIAIWRRAPVLLVVVLAAAATAAVRAIA
jgi:branched-subunit amino acid transport protein